MESDLQLESSSGLFITFEGLEGGGKTTAMKRIAEKFRANGYSVVETREPGGTELGEKIREELFGTVQKLLATSHIGPDTLPESYIDLWFQAQASTVEKAIKPALEEGKIVLCDRFADTALAFFGYGARRNIEEIIKLNKLTAQGLVPDLTILFDLPLEIGLRRKGYITNEPGESLYNPETAAFYKEVERGYQLLFQNNHRWRRIDATKGLAEVESAVWQIALEGSRIKGVEFEGFNPGKERLN